MQLPGALQPWSAQLGLLAEDLRFPLGGVVQKLASVIGPLAIAHSAWDGEPDGFDGLERRGPYDRLLVSEWLMADEAPLEFIRRAAMGEHVFLRLARPEPSGDRLSLALFDAGPSQMGAPRLVHLALLVLLARRAEAARARFRWGIVQEPDLPLTTALDEAALLRLLEARTALGASEAHVSAWTEQTRAWPRLDECWWIGGAPLAPLVPDRATRVVVDDVLDPGVRRVDVQVAMPGRVRARVPLELPADDACTRLLRDPFGRALVPVRAQVTLLRPTSELVFSGDGRKVFGRLGERGVVAFPIPGSARDPAARPRRYETFRPVLAADRGRRTIFTLVPHPRGVEVRAFGRTPDAPYPMVYADKGGRFVPPQGLRALWRPGGGPVEAFLLDEEDTLYGLVHPAPGVAVLRRMVDHVVGARLWNGTLVIAHATGHLENEGVWLSRLLDDAVAPLSFLGPQVRRVLFGATEKSDDDPIFGPLAFHTGGREWSLRTPSQQMLMIAPEGTTVLGVGRRNGRTGEAGLLVLEDDRRRLTLLGRNWQLDLRHAASPIEQATFDPLRGQLAYLTRDELVVLRVEDNVLLLRTTMAIE